MKHFLKKGKKIQTKKNLKKLKILLFVMSVSQRRGKLHVITIDKYTFDQTVNLRTLTLR